MNDWRTYFPRLDPPEWCREFVSMERNLRVRQIRPLTIQSMKCPPVSLVPIATYGGIGIGGRQTPTQGLIYLLQTFGGRLVEGNGRPATLAMPHYFCFEENQRWRNEYLSLSDYENGMVEKYYHTDAPEGTATICCYLKVSCEKECLEDTFRGRSLRAFQRI